MAILMLINSETVVNNLQYIFDVVKVYSDSHTFTPTELERYDFLTVYNTKTEFDLFLNDVLPKTSDAYLWDSDGSWHFSDSPDVGSVIDETEVYQLENDTRWYKLVNGFKFKVNIGSLTAEEKQLLATYDINHPAVNSFARKIIKDLTADPLNQEELKDLKGQQPY